MATITFWTNPMSRGQIAHWMLEEAGEPYETVWLDWGRHKEPAYLAVNPMGKVPAIRHGAAVVTEAAAICLYLADAFPAASRAMGWEASPERKMMLGFGDYDDAVGALEGQLKDRSFVCGAAFTAADVYVGSAVDWGLAFKTMPALPAFERYAARLRERPAYQRAKALNAARTAEAQAGG